MSVTANYGNGTVHIYDVASEGSLGGGKAMPFKTTPGEKLKAIRTGDFRPPRKGEWYLSGAIPEAYRAPHDLTSPYHIVILVRVVPVTTYEVYSLTPAQQDILNGPIE